MPSVSIIILNWNGYKNTIECLESLYQIKFPNYEVILIDNGSIDRSLSAIIKWVDTKQKIKCFETKLEDLGSNGFRKQKNIFNKLPSNKRLFVIKADKNYGFTGGNNIAINQILKESRSEYILLLNNDTVVSREFLTELIKVAENRKKVGIVGPKIYKYDLKSKQKVIQSAGATINLFTGNVSAYGYKQIDRKQFDHIRNVDYVHGACLLIRREVIQNIGLLNDNLFAYFEDVDWCLRAKEKGYDVVYAPGSIIWHKGGESSSKMPELLMYYRVRNRFLIEKRFAGIYKYIFFLGYYLFVMFPLWIVRCLSKNKPALLKYFLQGLKDGLIS